MAGSFEGLGSPPWRVVGSAERKPRSLGVIDVPVIVVGMAIADGVIEELDLPGMAIADAVIVGDEAPELPGMAIGDGTIVAGGYLTADPASLAFGSLDVGDSSAALEVTITNAGGATVTVSAIATSGDFDVAGGLPAPIDPGDEFAVTVTFSPSAAGTRAGTLTIESDAGNDPLTVALAGTGASAAGGALSWLHTSGNQILDADDQPVRLMLANWFGMEGTNFTPHGTWVRSFKAILDQIKAMGFNGLRVPISGGSASTEQMPSGIDPGVNPEFAGQTAIVCFDLIVAYCGEIGLRVLLDHHRREPGAGADGSPISGSYTIEDWHATLTFFAGRYADNPVIFGIDVHNEPHDLDWNTWAGLAEAAAAAVHAVNPNLLIIVEGVGSYEGDFYWWGGQLKGVRDRPVVLGVPNRLVYSPHEYAHSVGVQAWLKFDWQPVAGWPLNLYAVWDDAWSFLFDEAIAPVLVGEFGGHFGFSASAGTPGAAPNGAYEQQWLAELVKRMNGSTEGGAPSLPPGAKGMSFAYWSFNPNSGDTGGLVQGDWLTPQSGKLALLAGLLAD